MTEDAFNVSGKDTKQFVGDAHIPRFAWTFASSTHTQKLLARVYLDSPGSQIPLSLR